MASIVDVASGPAHWGPLKGLSIVPPTQEDLLERNLWEKYLPSQDPRQLTPGSTLFFEFPPSAENVVTLLYESFISIVVQMKITRQYAEGQAQAANANADATTVNKGGDLKLTVLREPGQWFDCVPRKNTETAITAKQSVGVDAEFPDFSRLHALLTPGAFDQLLWTRQVFEINGTATNYEVVDYQYMAQTDTLVNGSRRELDNTRLFTGWFFFPPSGGYQPIPVLPGDWEYAWMHAILPTNSITGKTDDTPGAQGGPFTNIAAAVGRSWSSFARPAGTTYNDRPSCKLTSDLDSVGLEGSMDSASSIIACIGGLDMHYQESASIRASWAAFTAFGPDAGDTVLPNVARSVNFPGGEYNSLYPTTADHQLNFKFAWRPAVGMWRQRKPLLDRTKGILRVIRGANETLYTSPELRITDRLGMFTRMPALDAGGNITYPTSADPRFWVGRFFRNKIDFTIISMEAYLSRVRLTPEAGIGLYQMLLNGVSAKYVWDEMRMAKVAVPATSSQVQTYNLLPGMRPTKAVVFFVKTKHVSPRTVNDTGFSLREIKMFSRLPVGTYVKEIYVGIGGRTYPTRLLKKDAGPSPVGSYVYGFNTAGVSSMAAYPYYCSPALRKPLQNDLNFAGAEVNLAGLPASFFGVYSAYYTPLLCAAHPGVPATDATSHPATEFFQFEFVQPTCGWRTCEAQPGVTTPDALFSSWTLSNTPIGWGSLEGPARRRICGGRDDFDIMEQYELYRRIAADPVDPALRPEDLANYQFYSFDLRVGADDATYDPTEEVSAEVSIKFNQALNSPGTGYCAPFPYLGPLYTTDYTRVTNENGGAPAAGSTTAPGQPWPPAGIASFTSTDEYQMFLVTWTPRVASIDAGRFFYSEA